MPRRPLLVAAGAGCLAAVVGLGLAVRQQAGWPPGALLMTLLPLAAVAGFLAGEVRRHGFPTVVARWRWLLPALAALPGLYALRVAFGRPGSGEAAHDGPLYVGAYPSGAALAIGLGWTVGVLVVGAQRPRWRPWLLAAGTFLLAAASRGRPRG